ncbi:hypothetical protein SLS58_007888 [Diplodia intermedia]|uniref:Uncharacterized protein n=1 Tax=Diplodia intermedia TaxID=856260 RepID=A0ABR3TIS6_9PEZI
MLTVKALNADTSFLVTFSPSLAPRGVSASQLPGSFTILVDPWLQGPAQILSSKFSVSQHKTQSCVSSLAELPEPGMVLISQDKPDHCHEETLKQLPPNSGSIILAAPAAAKKIRRWNHFPRGSVHALEPFSATDDSRIFRLEIPSFSSSGLPGERPKPYTDRLHRVATYPAALSLPFSRVGSNKQYGQSKDLQPTSIPRAIQPTPFDTELRHASGP